MRKTLVIRGKYRAYCREVSCCSNEETNTLVYIGCLGYMEYKQHWSMFVPAQLCLDHSIPLNQRSDLPPPALYCFQCAEKVGPSHRTLTTLLTPWSVMVGPDSFWLCWRILIHPFTDRTLYIICKSQSEFNMICALVGSAKAAEERARGVWGPQHPHRLHRDQVREQELQVHRKGTLTLTSANRDINQKRNFSLLVLVWGFDVFGRKLCIEILYCIDGRGATKVIPILWWLFLCLLYFYFQKKS